MARVRVVLAWLFAVVVTLGPSAAGASPQDLHGFGARMPGMGMTGVAVSDDYEAVYANPAGLARARLRKVVAGLTTSAQRLRLDGSSYGTGGASSGMTIGFQLPLPFGGVLEDRLVLGAGFYTPAAVLQASNVVFPEVPQFPVLERTDVVALQVGLGIDLHGVIEGLRFGFAVSFLADTFGDIDVVLDETNTFRSTTETQLLASFAPLVGLTYDRGDYAFGLTYRHQSQARMELAINTGGLPVDLPQLVVGGLVQYDPPTVSAEGAWQPAFGLRVVVGVEVSLWNRWPGMQIRTSSGSNLAPDPDFRPTFSPRVGVERELALDRVTLALRGGYAFEPTPAPAARLAPNRPVDPAATPALVSMRLLDNHRQILTAGLGLVVALGGDKRFHLDAFGQLHLLMPREHEIGALAPSDPSFDPDARMRTDGWIGAGGLTAGLSF